MSRANNSRILRIKNAKFSEYCFYMNTNIQGDFQICISVPLNFRRGNNEQTLISRSSQEEAIFTVPQSSTQGFVQFNIFLAKTLILLVTLTNNSGDDVIKFLQLSAEKLSIWFFENQMEGNTCKCRANLSLNAPN